MAGTTTPFSGDHFSGHAASYSAARPTYPAEMFARLAALAPATDLALDCATGNGQAAVALAEHFDAVVATDASAEQIRHARPHPRVSYVVAPAEDTGLEPASLDLVTVAQALHWFDQGRFFDEVRRVLRPGGVFAAWTYGLFTVEPTVDAQVMDFYRGPIDPYWPPERRHVEYGYTTLDIPGTPLPFDAARMALDWTADEALAYLGTWSAAQRYKAATGDDAVARVGDDLRAAWGPERRTVEWPLAVVVRRFE